MGSQRLLLLDACCVINLYASGQLEGILRSLPYRCGVARYVLEEEALAIARSGGEPRERDRVELANVVDLGLLEVMTPLGEKEVGEYVRFARELDDGEAQTSALALVRGGLVATDDRKALRVLEREGVEAVQTSELVHEWVRRARPQEKTVRSAIQRIEALARFRPRAGAPHSQWWRELAGRA